MPIRLALLVLCFAVPARGDGPLRFERIVIDADFPGGYQVEVADVNGDKKPDIVALGGTTLAWYENPTWQRHVIVGETQGIINQAMPTEQRPPSSGGATCATATSISARPARYSAIAE